LGGDGDASGRGLDSDIVLLEPVHAKQHIQAIQGWEGVEVVLKAKDMEQGRAGVQPLTEIVVPSATEADSGPCR
jgi:hypothetical protein